MRSSFPPTTLGPTHSMHAFPETTMAWPIALFRHAVVPAHDVAVVGRRPCAVHVPKASYPVWSMFGSAFEFPMQTTLLGMHSARQTALCFIVDVHEPTW